MGNSTSQITQAQLEEYLQLTYLSKSEILSVYKMFAGIQPEYNKSNLTNRIPVEIVMEQFSQIKFNPFRERICDVFSSLKDGCFSFEDMLDFYSAMSEKCPNHVKARWAFRIFDFNGDSSIDKEDLFKVIDKLIDAENAGDFLMEEKEKIISILLTSMDIENNGTIGQLEFTHAIGKMDDFGSAFTFTV